MDDNTQQPNDTGVSTPPDGGNVSSTGTPPQESPEVSPQTQAPQTTQPQVAAQVQPQPLQPAQAALPSPKGVSPNDPNASHPSVQRAGVFHSIAQALAGGPRYRTTIDPNTGTTTREQVAMSTKDIGMAIALEAVGGALKGFSVPNGPGNVGRAAGAAGADAMEQQLQAKQQQEAQAQGDQARQYQTMEANMRMNQLAIQTGRMDLDSHQALVGSSAPQIQYLKENSPDMITAHNLSEQEAMDLKKYPIGDYYRLPDGTVPRLDENGQPVYVNAHHDIVDKDAPGAIQAYDNTYAVVSKGAKVPPVDENGKPSSWVTHANKWGLLPDNWTKAAPGTTVPGVSAAALDHKATALDQMQTTLDNFSGVLNQPDAPGTRTTKMPTIKDGAIQAKVDDTAAKYGIDTALARALVLQESGGNQGATSKKGALGVMQLMPDTAKQLGVDPSNVDQNIDGGMRYLSQLMDKYDGNVRLALSAYNAGPNNVTDHVPQNKETPGYVKNISDMVGLEEDLKTSPTGQKFNETDLHQAVKDNPGLASSVEKFQGMFNATGNYGQALDEMGKKYGQTAAGQIAQLFGGRTAVDTFDEKTKEMKEQNALRIKTREAVNKAQELSAQNEQKQFKDDDSLARTAAGTANDPGSGGIDSIIQVASMRGDRRERIVRMTKEYNPNFTIEGAVTKANTWKDFTTDEGKSSLQVKSGNTLLAHIGHAIDVNDEYRRSGASDLLNKPYNWLQEHTGDPRVKEFYTAQEPVKTEFLSLLQNNHALTQGDKEEGEILFNKADTPAQTERVYKTVAQTAAYRMKETNEQWRRVFNSNFPDLISDQAVQALGKLTDGKTGKNPAADILGSMDTGGTVQGSTSGRGTPGQTVSQALGRSGQQSQQSQQTPSAQNNWGAQGSEKPVWIGGSLTGYSADGGKTYSRKVGQQPAAQTQSFTTPSGTTMSLGQMIQANGRTGTVTGQHPDTKKAVVNWQ